MVDINLIENIVREAAKLFADRDAVGRSKEKGVADYVTAVDEAVEQFMQQKLGEAYPHIQFMGEEKDNSAVDLDGLVWVLDPVDGTTNLIHDYQNSAISLALLNHGEILLGIVYNPFSDEMYHAQKGQGSFLNGKAICVSNAESMSESLISIGTSPYYKEEAEENFILFKEIYMDCQDIRRCGSAAIDLVHVACGRIDGYMEKHLKIWDYAAGTLIVREAGGEVLNYAGENLPMELTGNVVAGNRHIAKILVQKYLR